jgi:hypothetical protein
MNSITQDILDFISKQDCKVIFREDLIKFGTSRQITRALKTLKDQAIIVSVGKGLYCKAEISKLTGNPMPCMFLEEIAIIVFNRYGIPFGPNKAVVEYNAGRSTQIPMVTMFNIGKSKFNRKISFNKGVVEYERLRQDKRDNARILADLAKAAVEKIKAG